MNIMILLLLPIFLAITHFSNADEPFDVRKHLATVSRSLSLSRTHSISLWWNLMIRHIYGIRVLRLCTYSHFFNFCCKVWCFHWPLPIVLWLFVGRYADSKDISANSFLSSEIPDQCTPIHLNLVVSMFSLMSSQSSSTSDDLDYPNTFMYRVTQKKLAADW